jgi:polar amino acid transport system substrate-binding protein
MLMLGTMGPVAAQNPHELRVATHLIAPFVMQNDGQFSGFSVELWRSIAQQMNVTSRFQVTPTVTDLLSTVKSGKADLGIANISITAKRDKDFDFSQPIYESGLQILVRQDSSHRSSIVAALKDFFSPAILQLLGIIVLIILIPANILWFAAPSVQYRGGKQGVFPRHLSRDLVGGLDAGDTGRGDAQE